MTENEARQAEQAEQSKPEVITTQAGVVQVRGQAEAIQAAPAAAKSRPARDRCMMCAQPPTHDVRWAEGMGRAWFCDKHYKSWKAEHPGEIVSEHKVKDGMVPEHWGGKAGETKADPSVLNEEEVADLASIARQYGKAAEVLVTALGAASASGHG